MVRFNSKKLIEEFSFIDYEVTRLAISLVDKIITIELSGASFLENNIRKELNAGCLVIENFDSVQIHSYEAIKNMEYEVNVGEHEELSQLCEIKLLGNKFIFKGFAVETCNWMEIEVMQGDFYGHFL